ncbi:MAG TPA: sigma-70 family RNA polymerase sigma factor [Gemmatimonadales bacterium]|jgi:RNA polymerase sigma factor (sigma-70 family)|nr:sigma-70 family RNA polymerase sigma factor [Gemmatimonadales bacterium]
MPEALPPEVAQLLGAPDPAARDQAWAHFLTRHSRLLLHTARRVSHDRDGAMDAYAFVLERLREDDHRRLRAYAADGRSKFTTWLVVVARRLCLDSLRQRYGRARHAGPAEDEARATRSRLVDLIGEELDAAALATVETENPETLLHAGELTRALESALAELPPRDRTLLALRFQDDVAIREIARLLGFPSAFHVYRRLHVLFDTLRQALRRRGVVDPRA